MSRTITKGIIVISLLALSSLTVFGDESEKTVVVKTVKGKKYCRRGWECPYASIYCCNQTISDYFQSYQFEDLFSKRNSPLAHAVGFWDYQSFITASVNFQPLGFGTTGGKHMQMKEIAAFLGHVGSKTSCGYGVATGGPLAWGLCYNREMSPSQSYCDESYKYKYPCSPGAEYYGRGALPIYWNFNYGATGEALKVDLLSHPEYIEQNATLAFQAAMWRWMTPIKKNQPSAHDIFVGNWKPTKNDTLAKRGPNFGTTMNLLYGEMTCGQGDIEPMNNIVSHYLYFLDLLGVGREEAGPHNELTCAEQKAFNPATAPSTASSWHMSYLFICVQLLGLPCIAMNDYNQRGISCLIVVEKWCGAIFLRSQGLRGLIGILATAATTTESVVGVRRGRPDSSSECIEGLECLFNIARAFGMGSCLSGSTSRDDEANVLPPPRKLPRSTSGDSRTELMLHRIPGRMFLNGSVGVASLFSRQGKKGVNQDAMIVWENFGLKPGTVFCGVFDGHGPNGHLVAKKVRDTLPLKFKAQCELVARGRDELSSVGNSDIGNQTSSLLVGGEEQRSSLDRGDNNKGGEIDMIPILKESMSKAFKVMDKELKLHPYIDSYCSGTTTVALVKQGQNLVIGNIGDSRAVLGSRDGDGSLVAKQLTVDLKPNLPKESRRIRSCKGRVFALRNEPETYRLWLPNSDSPGLAMSRAFGDFCLKGFGLISVPDITHYQITEKDEFVVLATDGVWDVLSNKEVIDIISSAPRASAAQKLVDSAVRAWRFKYPYAKVDDCAVVCLFLDSPSDNFSSYSVPGEQAVVKPIFYGLPCVQLLQYIFKDLVNNGLALVKLGRQKSSD
ncbi:hypothetical protein ACFE04_012918 [Oxalis oulophora]